MSIFSYMSYNSAVRDAAESRVAADNAEVVVTELRWQVNKLTLINMAMFELLQQRFGVTEEELVAKMTEIDMRDGHVDGHAPASGPVACEACGKTYSKRHNHCLYCGHVNGHSPVF